MIYYYFVLFLLFLFAIMELQSRNLKSTNKFCISIILVLLICQIGLRWETGTDWNAYFDHFSVLSVNNFTDPSETFFEVGYNIFALLSKLLFNNYSFFLVIHSIVFYYFLIKGIEFFTPNIFLCLLLFYSLNLGIVGSNRQLISLCLGFYSLKYLINNRLIYFFIFILVAFFFHVSSILFVFYFFLNRRVPIFLILLFTIISSIIGFFVMPFIFNVEFSFLPQGYTLLKLVTYLGKTQEYSFEYPYFGLFKRVIIVAFFLYYRKAFENKILNFNIVLNGYLLGVLFFFLFSYTVPIMISRGSLYFNIMESVLLSYVLVVFRSIHIKLLIIFIFFLLSFLLINQSISPYRDLFEPYKGIFINDSYRRNLY